MKIRTFEDWSGGMSSPCDRCGEEHWGEDDVCDDCRDSDLGDGPSDPATPTERVPSDLPSFGVRTTKSQNIYYL